MSTADTKQQLLNSAQDLIQRVGINAMSYNDLSEIVGITKASIHYHFPKKDDLINELLCSVRDEYRTMYTQIADSEDSAVNKLKNIAKIFENGVNENKICMVSILSAEHESLSETTHTTLKLAREDTVTIFEQIFLQGLKAGEFALIDDTYAAAYAFLSLLIGGQLISRASKDPEKFMNATNLYIHSMLKQ